MPEKTKRATVFISYSRKDKKWLERLRVHLRPIERTHNIEIWDDSKIEAGSKWKDEISNALNTADVAVLLISANFFASDYISSDELPPLLQAAERGGTTILPLIISPSRFTSTEDLYQFQAVNNPEKPLIGLSRNAQEKILVELSVIIERALKVTATRYVIKPKHRSTSPLNIALLLNGQVFYTREVLEILSGQLREALLQAGYAPVIEYAVGFPQSSKVAANGRVLKDLLNKFQNEKPDYLISVGTAVSEVVYKDCLNKIPIIFVAVTDPIRSKLVRTFDPDPSRGQIAGVVYGVPQHTFLGYFQRAFPGKRFGCIYHEAYPQDVAFKDQVVSAGPTLVPPLKVMPIKVSQPALSSRQEKQADIFFGRFFLLDNLQQFIANSAKPFVAGDISNLYKGVIACINTDSRELAKIAVQEIVLPNLLEGKALCDLPIFYPTKLVTGLNLQAARRYGISVSQSAIGEAQEVIR